MCVCTSSVHHSVCVCVCTSSVHHRVCVVCIVCVCVTMYLLCSSQSVCVCVSQSTSSVHHRVCVCMYLLCSSQRHCPSPLCERTVQAVPGSCQTVYRGPVLCEAVHVCVYVPPLFITECVDVYPVTEFMFGPP